MKYPRRPTTFSGTTADWRRHCDKLQAGLAEMAKAHAERAVVAAAEAVVKAEVETLDTLRSRLAALKPAPAPAPRVRVTPPAAAPGNPVDDAAERTRREGPKMNPGDSTPSPSVKDAIERHERRYGVQGLLAVVAAVAAEDGISQLHASVSAIGNCRCSASCRERYIA